MASRSNFSPLLIEGIRKVFFDALDPKSMVYKDIFDIQSSNKRKETDHTVAGIGMLSEKAEGEPTTYDDFVDGYSVDYIHTTYAKGIRITQELLEDELYGVIKKRSQALANSARYRMEFDHASLFNNANNTNVFTGGDGKALLSALHPLAAAQGEIYSNTSSSDLSGAALETAMTNFRRMKNDRGLNVAIEPNVLLVPPELEFDALEILKSTGKPYTADNEVNPIQGRLQVKVWDYLTDASSWFVLSDKRYGAPISFNRVPISFKEDGDFDTDDLKMKARTRYSFGFSDWRWVYGSMGAT
jgi:phage major head subunit gpT-like protein